MLSIYNFSDYKKFFNDWVESQPKSGHGEFRKLALHLNISTTMISQIFRGSKDISLELACELSDYLGFEDEECDYFILLVEHSKAGSHKLQNKLQKQIKARQEKAKKIDTRIKNTRELTEEERAIFYSSWLYTGSWILADLAGFDDAATIAQRLGVPRAQIQRVLEFLVDHNLCVLENAKLKVGPTRTHLKSSSPLVPKHHQNWRLQGFNKMLNFDDKNFFYTSPLALSKEAADQIHRELPKFIEQINKIVLPSASETVRCLNIDWFEY